MKTERRSHSASSDSAQPRHHRTRNYDEVNIKHEDKHQFPIHKQENSKDSKSGDIIKEVPNYKPSGLLAAESNRSAGGKVLKYNEPSDKAKPEFEDGRGDYYLYEFTDTTHKNEDDDIKQVYRLNQKSCYLLGRDKIICDIPLDIPSSSNQHAAIQFRRIFHRDNFGDTHEYIRPYLIDLESSYGTKLNGDSIPSKRFIELREKDVLQFGGSKRDFLLVRDSD